MRVFVSYSHAQSDWVARELCVVLRAGGADVLVDSERFKAGGALVGQMDALQDQAEIHVLVLSPEYVASTYCMHELRRAVSPDPLFTGRRVVPVVRVPCQLPTEIVPAGHEPLRVEFREGHEDAAWRLLLEACSASLGCSARNWLDARRDLDLSLARHESVNLVVRGHVAWRPLIAQAAGALQHQAQLGVVDLASGTASSRRGLLTEMLDVCGHRTQLPSSRGNEDLVAFTRALRSRATPAFVALQHFDYALLDDRDYGLSFFSALRDLAANDRKLCLLVHSKVPFLELLPAGHPLSSLTQLRVLELAES
ncbi:MAG: toll/interleukin-1 receptor domain-containing protein [Polyangiales bacterium]